MALPDDLLIRAPVAADLAALTALMNLPGVRAGTLRLPYTREHDVERRFLAPDRDRHTVVGLLGADLVAIASLGRDRERRAHCGSAMTAVHDRHAGRGIGHRMMAALLDLADNWLGLVRLELQVNVDNHAAIRLYERLGFEREGLQRASILRDGALIDCYIMARLRPPPHVPAR